MPDLASPLFDDTPPRPDAEYAVEVDNRFLYVHFSGRSAYVRLDNGDHLDVKAYTEKYLKPSLREGFLKNCHYLFREFNVPP